MSVCDGSILVTGSDGFIGTYLVRALRRIEPQLAIYTTSRNEPAGQAGEHHLRADLSDVDSIDRLVERSNPSVVFHLAAQSSVGVSLQSGSNVWDANVGGTHRLAKAIRLQRPEACFIFSSSAEVYGRSFKSNEYVDEETCPWPLNPYARSKLAAEFALRDVLGPQAKLIIMRLFNHVGPGQGENFVTASFAAQLARLERGSGRGAISVGDLSACRDFGAVNDAIAAFMAVFRARESLASGSVFNVCSGTVRSVSSVLDSLISLSSAVVDVTVDPDRLRPIDMPRAAGSCAKLKSATDWVPRGLTDENLREILEYWRKSP